jgi:hypothetical protein
MSFFRKAKEATADLAAASKRQAQRGKLEIEVKRLESKVSSEKDAIGHALFPLLEAGGLKVDLPEVGKHLETVAELVAEIAAKRAEIAAIGAEGGEAEAASPAPSEPGQS